MLKRSNVLIFAILALLQSINAVAYEIGVMATAPEHPDFSTTNLKFAQFERNHERMTALALLCLSEQLSANPTLKYDQIQCSNWGLSIGDIKVQLSRMKSAPGEASKVALYKDLIQYVRWPDDPTRLIHKNMVAADKFVALTKLGGCLNLAEGGGDGKFEISRQGLLCNSHYGKLQFFHSMAEHKDIPASDTRALINEWATFTFKMATGSIKPSSPYCDFWEKNPDFPNLSGVMYEGRMREIGWCDKRSSYWRKLTLRGPYPAWTVGDTFNLICKSPLESGICTLLPSLPDDEGVRKTALGALLHLLQDSYSKSHTERGDDHLLDPQIILSPVRSYRSYAEQDSKKHDASDKWPGFPVRGSSQVILDPVTASARAIWLVMHNEAVQLPQLMNEVLGPVRGEGGTSGPGGQYKKL